MSKVYLYAEIQVSIPFSKIDWQAINAAMKRAGSKMKCNTVVMLSVEALYGQRIQAVSG